MRRRQRKPVVLAIKVSEDLAEFLDNLPNKSEFVRQAILARMQVVCPLCSGQGKVAQGVGQHFRTVLDQHQRIRCQTCQHEETLLFELPSAAAVDRPRWEQFLHGGPFYCADCYKDDAADARQVLDSPNDDGRHSSTSRDQTK